MASNPMNLLLRGSGLTKRYPGVAALSDVDFDLREGEVHALVGENGAGKSTLVKILAGIEFPDSGTVLGPFHSPCDSNAEPASADGSNDWNPSHVSGHASSGTDTGSVPVAEAIDRDADHGSVTGVRIVLQELNLISTLSVAENIFLDHLPSRFGIIDYPRMIQDTRILLRELGLDAIDPMLPVASLGIGRQQLVEIARGLARRCKVLILDEPTASLTNSEVDLLFAQIMRLKKAGTGIIYISHRLEEIRKIADRVTVLRDGERIITRPMKSLTLNELVERMVGRPMGEELTRSHGMCGKEVALRVANLTREPRVRGVDFEVHRGEILGFAGLMGSGRTETMRAIFGADCPEGGQIFLGGSDRPARIRNPRDAVRLGIGMVPEDRKGQGLLLPLSIRVNTTLTRIRGLLHPAQERRDTRYLVDNLAIRCFSLEQPVAQLSGGNQQKTVIAKWIHRDCDILIFDEPTRGIDVGAKYEIFKLLADLASQRKAILVVSSELKELMAICDRIAVMSAGKLVKIFNRGDWTQDEIMHAALSGYLE
ncbi:MAG: sugar ABC transporter ATP-binding protein [Pirellulales bacterium]|nr:sugar ABC transporter ATP-binding protein [Pirellulales bacterium]